MKLRSFLRRTAVLCTAAVIAFSAFMYSASDVVNIHADEQSDLEQELKRNKEKQAEIEKKISSTRGDIKKEKENQEAIEEQIETVEEYLVTLIDLINEYQEQIEALEDEITVLEAEIGIQERKIEDKRAEVDDIAYRYGQCLRSMYLSGNDSVASIILGSTDFFDMLMRMELVKRVANYNDTLIQSLNDTVAEYEEAELVLENQQAALEETKEITENKKREEEDRKAEWEEELARLNDLFSQSKKVLKELEDQKNAYQRDMETYEKENKALQSQIDKIIREKARAEYIGDLPQGTFLWPCPGHFTISSPYGSRWGTTHKGIDISASQGSDITAANSGQVIFVNNSCTHNYGKSKSCGCGSGFGNYCIIDHGGGYTTVYGHATKIIVKEGQMVKTGDTIGYVGSTGDSRGFHLHFETRIGTDRVDPQGSKINLKMY